MAAAVELSRAGLAPLVLEARPFVGGRVRSFVHASGDEIDNGQHLLMGCYHATFRLLDLIGTRHHVAVQQRLHVGFRNADGSHDLLAAARGIPSPLDVIIGLLRLKRLSIAERIGLLRVARAGMRGVRGDAETVASLLRRLRQSLNTQERLWNPIVTAMLNTAPHEASAALFLEVFRRAFLGSGDDSRLALPRAGLSQLFEPASAYVTTAGGTVELSQSVMRIEQMSDGYTVHVKDRDPITTERIVVAVPQAQASLILNGVETFATVAMSPIVSLYLWYNRDLPKIPEITALIGTSVQWVFNRRRMMGEGSARGGLLSCTISAADVEAIADNSSIVALADRELRRAFTELGGALLVDAIVLKEKHATFRAVPDMPRPGTRTSIRGLYLAGDWTSTGLPATIEGAVQSGFDAAAALIDDAAAS